MRPEAEASGYLFVLELSKSKNKGKSRGPGLKPFFGRCGLPRAKARCSAGKAKATAKALTQRARREPRFAKENTQRQVQQQGGFKVQVQ
jgi:hypothetical protein